MSERWIHDPVPKNVTKFPIHQTYLTTDGERTANGGYKFKCPEVWSRARSGKKSIALRSIQWNSKTFMLEFILWIKFDNSTDDTFIFSEIIPERTPLLEVFNLIKQNFNQWQEVQNQNPTKPHEYEYNLTLEYTIDHTVNLGVGTRATTYKTAVTKIGDAIKPSESWNYLLNQPLDYNEYPGYRLFRSYDNVWDRVSSVHFHASFIPFDNYQYMGALFEKWYTPIIYQDANSSPLFNVWTTLDMKNAFPILHEEFIIRISFIISSEVHYEG